MNIQLRKQTVPIEPSDFLDHGDTRVYWLSGAGFLINSRGINLLIDPVLTRDPVDEHLSEAGLPLKIDFPVSACEILGNCYVLYTHGDIDHLGPLTALTLAKKRISMIGTLSVFERLARIGIPTEQIQVLRTGEALEISGITVESVPADHPWQLKNTNRGGGRPYRMGDCCGYILNTPDGRMYFPGDTRLMEEHLRIQNIDLLALDVSTCEYHLNHTSAVVLADRMAKADLIPFHYGTYDCPHIAAHCGEPEEVFKNVTNGEERGFVLAPGQPFILRAKDHKTDAK